VLRERVNEYLKANGGPGPTTQCIVLYYVTFVFWWVNFVLLYQTGKFYQAMIFGVNTAILGGFGHNWIH
jgi:hypothetical protein